MDALTKEWKDPDQHPKKAQCGDAWPMFPNPRHDPDASEQIVKRLRLAAEGRAPDEEGVYFTGRRAPLSTLVEWMQAGELGVFVLTGPAGSGKSAIAGRLASLFNPVQRARLLRDRPLESADPGAGSISAQVHVRRLTQEQVVAEIDRQLVRRGLLRPAPEGGARGRGALLDALERLPAKPLILIDGLDEAGAEAWSIARDVIAPDGRRQGGRGHPGAQYRDRRRCLPGRPGAFGTSTMNLDGLTVWKGIDTTPWPRPRHRLPKPFSWTATRSSDSRERLL